MEKRLVLVRLRSGSGADACVSRAHVDCVSAQAHRRHVILNPHHAFSYSHELWGRVDLDRVRWLRPEASGSSCPLQTPVASLSEICCCLHPR